MFQIISKSFNISTKRYIKNNTIQNINKFKYFSTDSNNNNNNNNNNTENNNNNNNNNTENKTENDSNSNTTLTLEETNASLLKQVKEMRDKVIRAYADEENVRRIAKRDVENARIYANTKFAKSLLDVADNLERALAAANSEVSDEKKALKLLVEGVDMTHTQLKKVFESHGVIKYGEVGDSFDPSLHDALFQVNDPTKTPGTIAQVLKTGYKLHDRVIRAAEVGTISTPEN